MSKDKKEESPESALEKQSFGQTEPAGEIVEMTLSTEHAMVMAVFGAGLIFCAGLLGVAIFQRFLPMFWKVALWFPVLFLAWAGLGWMLSAMRDIRKPVFTLYPDKLVCHDIEGDWEAPLKDIQSARFETKRGIKALELQIGERKVSIPETLRQSEAAFERLGPRED